MKLNFYTELFLEGLNITNTKFFIDFIINFQQARDYKCVKCSLEVGNNEVLLTYSLIFILFSIGPNI